MIQFIIDHWTSIVEGLTAFGLVVEISPIKIYPLRWLGNRINADIKKDIDVINKKFDKHIDDSARKEMKSLRSQILDFSDRIQNGSKPSKDAFTHIFDAVEDYHKLINDYNLTNGLIDIEVKNIKKVYAKMYLGEK